MCVCKNNQLPKSSSGRRQKRVFPLWLVVCSSFLPTTLFSDLQSAQHLCCICTFDANATAARTNLKYNNKQLSFLSLKTETSLEHFTNEWWLKPNNYINMCYYRPRSEGYVHRRLSFCHWTVGRWTSPPPTPDRTTTPLDRAPPPPPPRKERSLTYHHLPPQYRTTTSPPPPPQEGKVIDLPPPPPPPLGTMRRQAVCILLECILVSV